jgi:hypothetical protein
MRIRPLAAIIALATAAIFSSAPAGADPLTDFGPPPTILYLGLYGGPSWSSLRDLPWSDPFGTGLDRVDVDGLGYSIGAEAFIPLGQSNRVAIMPRVYYRAVRADAEVPITGTATITTDDDTQSRRVQMVAATRFDADIVGASAFAAAIVPSGKGWAMLAGVGPSLELVVDQRLQRIVRLADTEEGRFTNEQVLPTTNDGRMIVTFSDAPSELRTLWLGASARVALLRQIGDNVVLGVGAEYRFMFVGPVRGGDLSSDVSVGVGVMARFEL